MFYVSPQTVVATEPVVALLRAACRNGGTAHHAAQRLRSAPAPHRVLGLHEHHAGRPPQFAALELEIGLDAEPLQPEVRGSGGGGGAARAG